MRSPVVVEPAHPLLVAYAGLLGLVLGSFLNVCIVRWGAEPKQSVVRPRSRCPRCGHEIRWYENIPVLSWLALRARCSGCGLAISPLYPAVELTTGLLWAGAVLVLGSTLGALQLAVAATLLLGIAVRSRSRSPPRWPAVPAPGRRCRERSSAPGSCSWSARSPS
jgi:prepilin signal peptidase PulO-like enzyme (type II secretory pathway)